MIKRSASDRDKAATIDRMIERCDDFMEPRPAKRGGRRLLMVANLGGSLAVMPVREDDIPEELTGSFRDAQG